MQGMLGPWGCMDCGNTQADNGVCARCGSDPLLDLRQAHVRTMLVEEDDRLRSKRENRVRVAAVPVAMVAVILLCFVPGLGMLILGALPFFMGPILAMAGIALLIMLIVRSAFPYRWRFPYLRSG